MVVCLTRDRGVACSSLIDVTAQGPRSSDFGAEIRPHSQCQKVCFSQFQTNNSHVFFLLFFWLSIFISYTVKTLYNVIRYNRIFNIRHKIAGNRSVSIKIPSLQQNIHLTTPTVTSGNRYTISIENKFIITELLPCVR